MGAVDFFFTPADEAHQKRERAKARDLRQSQWWRQQIGRGRCYYCEQAFVPRQLTMDHKVPIVRGGMTTRKNVVVACFQCNQDKKYHLHGEHFLRKNELHPAGE
jgi:5-methylcytosine-specific restriction protein A